ncbi:MAG: acyloxyacyl hydrolase [Bacteroidales bacterium]|nr:acyloxyacyl hydrolase [Bacteroidales bacterium]
MKRFVNSSFRKIFFLFVMLLLGGFSSLSAQQEVKLKNDIFYEYDLRCGRVIPNFPGEDFWVINLYGFDVRIGKTTFGKKEWTQWHNYPSYGIALRYGHFDKEMFGDKLAIFWFLEGQFVRAKWFSFRYQFGAGLAYFKTCYDWKLNPDNLIIGSHVTAHIDLNLAAWFRVSNQMELGLKANFSHSSNGAIKFPNYGINPLSANLAMRYHFKPMPEPIYTIDTVTSFHPINSFHITLVPTWRKSKEDYRAKPDDGSVDRYADNPDYFAGMIQLGYYRQFHPKYRYGAGIDLMYSSELRRHIAPDDTPAEWKYFTCAAYLSFEVLYNRFVLHTALAYYLYRYDDFYTPYYERAGFKILLGKNYNHYVGVSLKAHSGMVDYVEWTYGCDFVSWKDKKPRIMRHHIKKNSVNNAQTM